MATGWVGEGNGETSNAMSLQKGDVNSSMGIILLIAMPEEWNKTWLYWEDHVIPGIGNCVIVNWTRYSKFPCNASKGH